MSHGVLEKLQNRRRDHTERIERVPRRQKASHRAHISEALRQLARLHQGHARQSVYERLRGHCEREGEHHRRREPQRRRHGPGRVRICLFNFDANKYVSHCCIRLLYQWIKSSVLRRQSCRQVLSTNY